MAQAADPTIIWVDSDPHVSASILEAAGHSVRMFNETQAAMDFLSDGNESVECIITSTMKRDGRAEKDLPSSIDLIDFVRTSPKVLCEPLFAFISSTVDEQEALREREVSIFVRGDRNRLQKQVLRMLADAHPTIVWVDSDPNASASILEAAGHSVRMFNETQAAMDFLAHGKYASVECIITSSMKRGGRAEKGLPSGIDLIDFVVQATCSDSYKPLFAFITLSADEQEVLERGVSIFVRGDRGRMQREVLRMLGTTANRDFRLNRKPGEQCDWELREFARSCAERCCDVEGFGKYHNAYADLCFCRKCEPIDLLMRAGERCVSKIIIVASPSHILRLANVDH
jgi:hypothetical protein